MRQSTKPCLPKNVHTTKERNKKKIEKREETNDQNKNKPMMNGCSF